METIDVKEASIVHSKGQGGFEEVADAFIKSKWIDI